MTEQTGKFLVIAGIVIAFAGLILWLAPGMLKWFGHLPGDFKIDKPGFRFYAPIGSMILLSLLASLLLWIFRKMNS